MDKRRKTEIADDQEQQPDLKVQVKKRCQLTDLPNEILSAICEELDQACIGSTLRIDDGFSITHPTRDKAANGALAALCLTCKQMCEIIRPSLFRNITTNSFDSVIQALLRGPPSLRLGTRHLTVRFSQHRPPSTARLALLEQALASFPERFRRSGRVAKASITGEKTPQDEIKAERFEVEAMLALVPNLQTLQIDLPGLDYFKRCGLWAPKKVLMCDWIRYQGINLGFNNLQTFVLSSGAPEHSYRQRNFILHGVLQCMPNLRHLVLYDIRINPRYGISAAHTDEIQLLKPCLSKLRSFTIRFGTIFDTNGEFRYLRNWFGMCTSLEEFSISWSGANRSGSSLSPTRLLKALVNTRSTLKLLSMEIYGVNEAWVDDWFCLKDTRLSQFANLKTLRMDSLCLSCAASGLGPMLAGILPRSITKLSIVCTRDYDKECEAILLHIGVIARMRKYDGQYANLEDCVVEFGEVPEHVLESFNELIVGGFAGTGVNSKVRSTRPTEWLGLEGTPGRT